MFKKYFENQEKMSMVAIYEKLLTSSEDYLMKTMGQALGMTGGSFPDSIDPEQVKLINQALAYWKDSKSLCLRAAQIADNRYENLEHQLREQASLLEQQTKTLEEISRKLDKTSKTKAE